MLTRLWLACDFTSQIYRAALKLIWSVSLKLQINSYLTWQQFFGRCRTVSYFKLTSSLCRVYGSMLSSDPFMTKQQFFGLRSYYVMLQAYAGKTACDWPVFDLTIILRTVSNCVILQAYFKLMPNLRLNAFVRPVFDLTTILRTAVILCNAPSLCRKDCLRLTRLWLAFQADISCRCAALYTGQTPCLLQQSTLCAFSGFPRMPDIIHIWLAVWNNPA